MSLFFEVVFYPALVPHGGDDSESVLRIRELVKKRVTEGIFFARRERRELVPQGKDNGGGGEEFLCFAILWRIARRK